MAPALADAPVRVLSSGWDSLALALGGWIFKFPRHAEAEARLRREAAILRLVRPRLPLAVPDMVLHERSGLFSQHRAIPGEHLLAAGYARLDRARRSDLASLLAETLARIHEIPVDAAASLGVPEIGLALAPSETLDRLRPLLSPPDLAFAGAVLDELARLDEPAREVFGHFDMHGWNMAFDHAAGRLNGIFDFGDSGLGPRHKDLSYSAWIDFELCREVARRYGALTGEAIDPRRVLLHNVALQLTELAEGALLPGPGGPALMLEAWRTALGPGR